jgi:hypothetical protein
MSTKFGATVGAPHHIYRCKVRELQLRINELAGGIAKSLLVENLFKQVLKSVTGQPLALPNEDDFYEGDVQGD